MLFHIIKKDKEYWLVDQKKLEGVSAFEYQQSFAVILEEWKQEQVDYLSLLMDQEMEEWLLDQGFHKVSSIVEYTRELDDSFKTDSLISYESLEESNMNDADFAKLYDACRSGSANKNNLFSIEQIMESLESELGRDWRSHCFIFLKEGSVLGISIPHIEEGTRDEGRLFYFGVIPEERGKGYGKILHHISLEIMKQFHATYYVGSTDEENNHMIGIFKANGCSLRDKKGIYRINKIA